ncbi:hypothetical protein D7Z26_22690 [Cohnella endophytica]|uniref:Lipoprotein n=1 Tax=Cohnella endophytica TaxID=2419778 RepID=A0A494XEC6_9BACL|nr:hypothetical protein [Cohnella endophytica]RKP48011.1 hypothetical protein D7Z26_22690 [Cohnella endophytica]
MRKSLFSMLIVILALLNAGCADNAQSEHLNASVSPAIQDLDLPTEIGVQFGDGHSLKLTDENLIRRIIEDVKGLGYREVKLPDQVGQGFVLKFADQGRDQEYEYISTGYLRVERKLFQAVDEDRVTEINDYVIEYARNEIPGLLGE